MSTLSDVFQTALALPESERAELACQIILSFDPTSVTSDASDHAMTDVIKRRAERVASGEFEFYSIDETMNRIKAKLK